MQHHNIMWIYALVLYFLCACHAGHAETSSNLPPYNAGHITSEVMVEGRKLSVAVWYPTDEPASEYFYGGEESTNKGMVAKNAPLTSIEGDGFAFFLYSHGFGGSAIAHSHLGEAMAREGWIVTAPDHEDAVNAVRIHTGLNRRKALRLRREATKLVQAGKNFDFEKHRYRLEDAEATVDWAMEKFAGKIDETRMALGGHSFGGYTTSGVYGAIKEFHDPRFKALVLHSPGIWMFAEEHFTRIKGPVLYVIGEEEKEQQRPGGNKAQLMEQFMGAVQGEVYAAELLKAGHMSFNTSQRNHFLARRMSGSPEQLQTLASSTVDFLNYHHKGRDHIEYLLNKLDEISIWTP